MVKRLRLFIETINRERCSTPTTHQNDIRRGNLTKTFGKHVNESNIKKEKNIQTS